eukprot:1244569-Prymnesium_polylepis.1
MAVSSSWGYGGMPGAVREALPSRTKFCRAMAAAATARQTAAAALARALATALRDFLADAGDGD